MDLEAEVVCGFKFRVTSEGDAVNEGIWMIPENTLLDGRRLVVGEDVEKVFVLKFTIPK